MEERKREKEREEKRDLLTSFKRRERGMANLITISRGGPDGPLHLNPDHISDVSWDYSGAYHKLVIRMTNGQKYTIINDGSRAAYKAEEQLTKGQS